MKSAITLLASEIADALCDLSPEARLTALAIATCKTILGAPPADTEVESRLVAFKSLVETEVRRGAAQSRLPANFLSEAFLDQVWALHEGPAAVSKDKLRVTLQSFGDLDTIVTIARAVDGRFVGRASQRLQRGPRETLQMVCREALKPLRYPEISYDEFMKHQRPPDENEIPKLP